MQGVLLVNLGSPDSATEVDVRRYLQQFLMDPCVIDLPWLLRYMIVHGFVLPKRPKQSAEAYASIWQAEGSPLKVISANLADKLDKQMDKPVALAMRYGSPSIEAGLTQLLDQGVDEVFVFPLYPHYAMSTVETVALEVDRVVAEHCPNLKIKMASVFYRHPDYIEALVQSARPYLNTPFDHLLFSYHGLPLRHIRKGDSTAKHCLKQEGCCDLNNPKVQKTCYRHQVYETTKAFVQASGVCPKKTSVSFQSRLGKDKWLTPDTEATLVSLAEQGVKNLLVICPAFVADCLETLEEMGIRGKQVFLQAGGERFTLIPCLNEHPDWLALLKDWCENA